MNKGHTVVAAVAWVFALLVLALSSGASAQAKPKRAPKVIELEEIKIEGRVQKPNAFYILNRSSIGYEVMELRTTFVQEVVHAVRRDPF
jgi:hypothetical protein